MLYSPDPVSFILKFNRLGDSFKFSDAKETYAFKIFAFRCNDKVLSLKFKVCETENVSQKMIKLICKQFIIDKVYR